MARYVRYVTSAGALCAGCAPFLSGGVPRPEPDATVIGTAAGVVVAAGLALTRRRPTRAVAGVSAAGLAVLAWVLLVVDLSTGLTGDDVPVLVVGSVAVAVGALGSIGRRSRPAGSRTEQLPATTVDTDHRARTARWPARVGGVAAAVVVVAAAVVAPGVAEVVTVQAETVEARAFEPEPVVERPGGRQWAWQPPADVRGVVAAGHGVAVAMTDGSVVALDGSNGWSVWRYARPGARVGAVAASKDRKAVVVTFGSGRDTRVKSVVVLDAGTGAPRFELVVRAVQVEADTLIPGIRTLALRDDDVITGYDLVSGEARWRWSPPAGCTSRFNATERGRTTVLVPVECPDLLSVVALDEVTGQERWRHDVPLGADDGLRRDVLLHGSQDGAVVSLRVITGQALPGAVTDGLLDAETGRVLARPTPSSTLRVDLGVTPLLEEEESGQATAIRAIDPRTGDTTPLDVAACPVRSADTTTSTTYLRACGDNGRELTVVTQSLDGSSPTATPVRLDGSGVLQEVHLVAAPGAIVVTRGAFGGTPAPVVGLNG